MSAEAGIADHAEWRQWVEQNIGGDERAIEAATDAVIIALILGHPMETALQIARAAAAAPGTTPYLLPGVTPAVAAAAEPLPVSDRTHLRGQIAAMRQRNELMGDSYGSVWTFRVNSFDAAGAPQPPVAVELRGLTITGSIADGDWVEIEGHGRPGELREIRRLRNISLNAPVVAEGGTLPGPASVRKVARAGGVVLRVAVTLVVLLVAGAIALSVISSMAQ